MSERAHSERTFSSAKWQGRLIYRLNTLYTYIRTYRVFLHSPLVSLHFIYFDYIYRVHVQFINRSCRIINHNII